MSEVVFWASECHPNFKIMKFIARLIIYFLFFVFFLASSRASSEMRLSISWGFALICTGWVVFSILCFGLKYFIGARCEGVLGTGSFWILILLAFTSVLVGWLEFYISIM